MWPFKKKEEETYSPVQNNLCTETFKGLGDMLNLEDPTCEEETTPTIEDRVKELEEFQIKALRDISALQRRLNGLIAPARKPKRKK